MDWEDLVGKEAEKRDTITINFKLKKEEMDW